MGDDMHLLSVLWGVRTCNSQYDARKPMATPRKYDFLPQLSKWPTSPSDLQEAVQWNFP